MAPLIWPLLLSFSLAGLTVWPSPPLTDQLVSTTAIGGPEVVAKSIAYHDPQGEWLTTGIQFKLGETRPDGRADTSYVNIAEGRGYFKITQSRDGHTIHREHRADGCTLQFDHRSDHFTAEEIKKYRLSCETSAIYPNYYGYLWGQPMKLHDPGTIIDEQAELVDFFGQDLLQVKVTYSEEVGQDIWYFYFHPTTFALSGYRFYHDEAANDGEYILLSGEATVGQMRLPAKRDWYTHQEQKYLGTDAIID